jgi:lysozyme family protein
MSRDERRELDAIGRSLSDEAELISLEALFAQPPAATVPTAPMVGRPPDTGHTAITVGLMAAAFGLLGACLLAAVDRPLTIALAAVLAVVTGLGLVWALVRYAKRSDPDR